MNSLDTASYRQAFADKLAKHLAAKQLTPYQFAKQTGTPLSSITAYLRAQRIPRRHGLKAMADALGCNPFDLLPQTGSYPTDDPYPSPKPTFPTASITLRIIDADEAYLTLNNQKMPTQMALKIIQQLKELEKHNG